MDAEPDCCWVCLASGQELHRVCGCPRVAHKACVARWQLQQAGRSEERFCRFCQQEYPDWREALTPVQLAPTTPVMAVSVRGRVHKLRVQPGPEGKEDFKRQVRALLGYDDSVDFDVIFECKTPHSGEKVQLHGFSAFDAATHCAAVSAAKRLTRNRAKQAAGLPSSHAANRSISSMSSGSGDDGSDNCSRGSGGSSSSSRGSGGGSSSSSGGGSSSSSGGWVHGVQQLHSTALHTDSGAAAAKAAASSGGTAPHSPADACATLTAAAAAADAGAFDAHNDGMQQQQQQQPQQPQPQPQPQPQQHSSSSRQWVAQHVAVAAQQSAPLGCIDWRSEVAPAAGPAAAAAAGAPDIADAAQGLLTCSAISAPLPSLQAHSVGAAAATLQDAGLAQPAATMAAAADWQQARRQPGTSDTTGKLACWLKRLVAEKEG